MRGECAHVARTPLDLHSEKDSLENCCLAHTTDGGQSLHTFLGEIGGVMYCSHIYVYYSEQADANFLGSAEATLFAGHQSLKGARGGGCFVPSHFNCTKALVIQGTEKSQGLPKRFD